MTAGTGRGWGTVSRRRYTRLLGALGVGALGGCVGAGGRGDTDSAGDPAAETDVFTVAAATTLESTNYNFWAEERDNEGIEFLTEIAAPVDAESRAVLVSDHAHDGAWAGDGDQESVSIPSMLADYSVRPPDAVVERYDDRLTYWDGTALDAEARRLHHELTWQLSGDGPNAVDPDAEFGNEVVEEDGDQLYLRRFEPTSEPVLASRVFQAERVPMHPQFTRPYVESLRDATTESEASSIAEELRADRISVTDIAEKGWGSGPYELRSADDVTEERLELHLREDHPTADHAALDRIDVQFASTDQQVILAREGGIDLAGGVVGQSGDVNRDVLPDHLQQIDRFLAPESDTLLFDWTDHHLQRLWVRRAIVAAVDWYQVGAQGWGEQGSRPTRHDTGLHGAVNGDTFGREFLDQLYQYPREYDAETAVEWLERAGYSGSRSEGWESPEGEPLELTITANDGITEHVQGARTVQANLLSLGVEADLALLPEQPDFTEAMGGAEPGFDLAFMWATVGEPWEFYWGNGEWWSAPLLAGDPDEPTAPPAPPSGEDDGDELRTDTYGVPLRPELPADVGAIEAPDEAGRAPSLPDGERVDLPEIVHSFRDPDADPDLFQDRYRTCAQFYNYYLPQFRFHDVTWGVWGDVRDFEFPPAGNGANRVTKGEFSGHDYLALSGLPRRSDDADYPEPPAELPGAR